MDREQAWQTVCEFVQSEGLRKHMLAVEACLTGNASLDDLSSAAWRMILPPTKLSANKRHFFADRQLQVDGAVSHVRLNIFPDGGVSRLRIHGTLARS